MKNPHRLNNSNTTQKILDELDASMNVKYRTGVQRFRKKYSSVNPSDVQWRSLCQDANEFGCMKYIFLFITKLLEQGLYQGEYRKELYDILPMFQKCASETIHSSVRHLLCGERITDLIIFTDNSSRKSHFMYFYLQSQNPYIKTELIDFIKNEVAHYRNHSHAIMEVFEVSLGDYISGINDHTCFTDTTFWQQINYYKRLFPAPADAYRNSIKAVCCFYRWLVNKYNDYPFFNNAFSMTKSLLFCPEVIRLISEGYYFMTYSPRARISDHQKICLILRNMEHLSTKIKPESHTLVDLSGLRSHKYRQAVLAFIRAATNISTLYGSGHIIYAADALAFFEKLKGSESYPNPALGVFTTQEAVLVRNYCNDESMKLSTRNNRIGAVRRFLQWCEADGTFTFESMFFDYLKQYEEPSKTKGSSIPDADLAKLGHYLSVNADKSVKNRLALVVFHLAIQTEFRISQILHLTADCIRPSLKAGEYVIHSNSKTSHGAKSDYIITGITFRLLVNTIEFTESLRAGCNIEALKDYIFLYPGRDASIHHYNATIFRDCLKAACRDIGFSMNYSASNLRDTHMTKALEHIMRNGKSDIEMGLLSKHKHLDTTKSHYIELELEKMLEATYGITIGSVRIDATSKVVDRIPASADSDENDVEYGCGKCTACECVMKSSLPCMVCAHFITTVDHAPFFIRAIENVDRLIAASENRHDTEDLNTIKSLYCAYLEAIYKIKEHIS